MKWIKSSFSMSNGHCVEVAKLPFQWVKSSLSHANGNCVEVAWTKSSLSFSNGNCVEVTQLPEHYVGVRNSRHPDGAMLTFTPAEWSAFIGGAKKGEFDKFGAQSEFQDADSDPE